MNLNPNTNKSTTVNPNTVHGSYSDLQDEMKVKNEKLAQLYEERVKQSREQHDAFVRHYMGENYEPKFSNVLQDETYFVMFFRTKKASVTIPPVMMGGQEEQVKPGRMYACSGKEARMFERTLATKKLEVLNLTPKRDGIMVRVNWICQNWAKLNGIQARKPARKAFDSYKESAHTTTSTGS